MLRTVAALCWLAIAAVGAAAQESGDARRGLGYAEANCAECHAVRQSDAVSPRPDVATFKVIADTPGMTAMALSVWLQTTHREMPNLIIPPDDRNDVIAYILSLRDRRTGR